jgi:hypothetical protein
MLVPKDPFLLLILSTGVAWLVVFLAEKTVKNLHRIFSQKFISQNLNVQLQNTIVFFIGLCLFGALVYLWVIDRDAFYIVSFLLLLCGTPLIFFSALILFGMKLILKRIAPVSNAGWRTVFTMIGGSCLSNLAFPLNMLAPIVLLPFIAFCAIFFDILGAICVKWFQTRKAGQSNR